MTVIEERATWCACSRRITIFIIVCASIFVGGGVGYYFSQRNEVAQNEPLYNSSISNSPISNSPISSTTKAPVIQNWETNEDIQLFRDNLRINSAHPDPNYDPCIIFLEEQAKKLNLPLSIHHPVDDRNPVLVMTWNGSEPDLPSIVLNSHMDVVPVFEEYWTYPPFGAEMDKRGNIYARGAQDMKSVGAQYLAAIRQLKIDGVSQFKRTIHLLFVPDEELGSTKGMKVFVPSDAFKKLNVGFVLDEGGVSNEKENYVMFYAERTGWTVNIICHGKSGHGSIMSTDTAFSKLIYIMNKFDEMREFESQKNESVPGAARNITSINLTVIKGGVEGNVVPPEMSVVYDIRLAVDADHDAFEKQIYKWCEEAGGNITVNIRKGVRSEASAIDDANPFWTAFKNASDSLNLPLVTKVFGAATDSRFIRNLGIPAFGFSPIIHTDPRAHDNDEYLNVDVYLKGIEIYKRIIENLANVK